MKELEEKITKFAVERDWLKFYTAENLAKGIYWACKSELRRV